MSENPNQISLSDLKTKAAKCPICEQQPDVSVTGYLFDECYDGLEFPTIEDWNRVMEAAKVAYARGEAAGYDSGQSDGWDDGYRAGQEAEASADEG